MELCDRELKLDLNWSFSLDSYENTLLIWSDVQQANKLQTPETNCGNETKQRSTWSAKLTVANKSPILDE